MKRAIPSLVLASIYALICGCLLLGCASAQQQAINAADTAAASNDAAIKLTDQAFKAGELTKSQADAAIDGEATIAKGIDATVVALSATQPATQP